MLAILDLIPKWILAALVAMLAATSCKLKWDNGQLSIEVEKHATRIAELNAGIQAANATAATQAARFEQQARTAEQARSAREQTLLADAAGAKSELERLRTVVASARSAYSLSAKPSTIAPSLDPTDTFAELFLESTERYTSLAAACDRHVNDIQTLMAAWPR